MPASANTVYLRLFYGAPSLQLQGSINIRAARQCVDSQKPQRQSVCQLWAGSEFEPSEPLGLELLHRNCARLLAATYRIMWGTDRTDHCGALRLHEPACFIDFVVLPKYPRFHRRSVLGKHCINNNVRDQCLMM